MLEEADTYGLNYYFVVPQPGKNRLNWFIMLPADIHHFAGEVNA